MAKTFTAPFAQTPKTFTAVATAAIGALNGDSPTGTVELVVAGSEGAIVTSITAIPRATTTASNLVVFISKGASAQKRLILSLAMKAHTVDPTTAIPINRFEISESEPLRLEAGDKLHVGTTVAVTGGVVFTAQSTDY